MTSSNETRTTQAKPPHIRSMRETLGMIVVGFQILVMGLSALVIYGLADGGEQFGIIPVSPVAALVGGAIFIVLMIAAIRTFRYEWGLIVGWVLEGITVLFGLVHPGMFVVGALFLGMWAYCMWQGGKIDHARAPIIAEYRRRIAEGELDPDAPAGSFDLTPNDHSRNAES